MDAVVSVEEEIARQRYTYNNVVQELNTMIDTIPTNIIASSIGMKKLDYLRFEGNLEKAPEVKGIGPN
jgi:LemA protein